MGRRVLATAFLLLAEACTGGGSSRPTFHPSFAQAKCPDDVEIVLVVRHSCGFLTVLQDRSRPEGATIRLFVLKYEPPDEHPRPDPVLILGSDLGLVEDYGGQQPAAQRVHREVYSMDLRGTGHSTPSLACPEADAVSARGAAAETGDSELRQGFLSAVEACRARLVSHGIDPSAFDLPAMAADAEDLRLVLGIDSWNIGTYGNTSRVALEVIREFPEHVRAAYLDSPQFPQLDEPTEAALGTKLVLHELFEACGHDSACDKAYPDLEGLWSSAVARLEAKPVRVTNEGGVTVLVDSGAFVRGIRSLLGSGSNPIAGIPRAIGAAADGKVDLAIASALANGGAFCTGYLPISDGGAACREGFSLGASLSVLCRDEAPFVDASALRAAADLPGLSEAFGTNPLLAACSVWDVKPAGRGIHESVTSAIPTLLLTGPFDPFGPSALAKRLAAGLAKGFILTIPGESHNTLGYKDCPIGIRNAWIDDPSSPPADTACLSRLKVRFETP
jgi:pimeloyl-ACP methyl ester carboxylesterase